MKKDIQQIADQFTTGLIPYWGHVVSPFLSEQPHWAAIFYGAVGLYNTFLMYEQVKVNEIVEFIQLHPEKFSEQIVSSEEFKSTFLKFFGEYLLQAKEQKRDILKKLLLGYVSEEDKQYVEFSRLTSTLDQISIKGLENLIWIRKEIIPIIENHTLLENGVKLKYASVELIGNIRVSDFVSKWIYENYDPGSEKVKEQMEAENITLEQQFSRKKFVLKEKYSWDEYLSLHIVRMYPGGSSVTTFKGGGRPTSYGFTDFGEKFFEYIFTDI